MTLVERPSFISSRRFGDAVVSVISEGTSPLSIPGLAGIPVEEVRAAVPEADAEGHVTLAFTVTLVQIGGANVMIDAGRGNQREAVVWPTPGVEAALAELGVRPDEIGHVVFTHAHWDHIDGALVAHDGHPALRFANARHWIGRADWDVGRAGTHQHHLCDDELAVIDQLGALELVDGDREVVPGITMSDAPGESPGHHVVRVESGAECFIHLGDLFHIPAELEQEWIQVGCDAPAVLASRARVLADAEARNATVVVTHGLVPGWMRVIGSRLVSWPLQGGSDARRLGDASWLAQL